MIRLDIQYITLVSVEVGLLTVYNSRVINLEISLKGIQMKTPALRASLVLVLVLVSSWIPHAMAYIDPGSGSAIMSAIVGLFVAVSLAIKTYWYKIKSLFGGKTSGENTESAEDNENKRLEP